MRSIILTASIIGLAALLAAQSADARERKARTDDRWESGQQNVQSGRTADIYIGGRNMGTDPDPNIRGYIRRDWGAAFPGPD